MIEHVDLDESVGVLSGTNILSQDLVFLTPYFNVF